MKRFLTTLRKIVSYANAHQLGIQSNIFWIIAVFNFKTERFWIFAVLGIIFRGFQTIIDELKLQNKK